MNIYKTNFPTEQEGKDYLLSIGVLVETDGEIVFAKDTAAVVYIGKVVKIPATYDADGNIIAPAVYFDGYAIDVMSAIPKHIVFTATQEMQKYRNKRINK
jgi:hypothetical protein